MYHGIRQCTVYRNIEVTCIFNRVCWVQVIQNSYVNLLVNSVGHLVCNLPVSQTNLKFKMNINSGGGEPWDIVHEQLTDKPLTRFDLVSLSYSCLNIVLTGDSPDVVIFWQHKARGPTVGSGWGQATHGLLWKWQPDSNWSILASALKPTYASFTQVTLLSHNMVFNLVFMGCHRCRKIFFSWYNVSVE
jgi:hypothetical protein